MSTSEPLRLTFALDKITAASDADDRIVFTGHAATFTSKSHDLGGYRVELARGAFSDVLSQDVRLLFNHDPNMVLARTKSGSLTISQDQRGLQFTARAANTSIARDLRELVRGGDIDQCSFAAIAGRTQWVEATARGELPTKRIMRFTQLIDVCLCTFPAFEATNAIAAGRTSASKAERPPELLLSEARADADRRMRLARGLAAHR